MKRAYGWTSILMSMGLLCLGAAGGCGGGQRADGPASRPAEDERIDFRGGRGPNMDEDEDDGMQIEGLGGRLEPYHIRQGVDPHARAINDCHASHQGRQRYLGGSVELAYVVHADGTVKSVGVIQSDLGAWPVEQCLLALGRSMLFPRPQGNGEADFTLPLSFAARSRVTEWDPEQARIEVAGRLAELAACAGETGAGDPRHLRITLYVGTRGQVQSVGFASPGALLDDAWATCAEARILAWTLSDPRGQIAKMTFAYPAESP